MARKARAASTAKRKSKKRTKVISTAKSLPITTAPKPDHLVDTTKTSRLLFVIKDEIVGLIGGGRDRCEIIIRSGANKSIPDVGESASAIYSKLGGWQVGKYFTFTRQNHTCYLQKGDVESLWADGSRTEINIKGRGGSITADEDIHIIFGRMTSP